jgi:hypothetical protein
MNISPYLRQHFKSKRLVFLGLIFRGGGEIVELNAENGTEIVLV